MKQLYYVIRTLLRGRGSNIIKVISLGLGLTMSILLFSRVALNKAMILATRTMMIFIRYTPYFRLRVNNLNRKKQNCGPVAGAIFGEFSQRGRGGCQHCVFCFFTTLQWQCTHRCPENISRFTFFSRLWVLRY